MTLVLKMEYLVWIVTLMACSLLIVAAQTKDPATCNANMLYVCGIDPLLMYNCTYEDCVDSKIVKLPSVLCGKKSGAECCGHSRSYHPDFQTCCQDRAGGIAVVYDNMPQATHVCCSDNLTPHPRNGTIPCRTPAHNDKMFKAKKRFNEPPECLPYMFVVKPNTQDVINVEGFTAYTATVTTYRMVGKKSKKKDMAVLFDEYSAKVGKRCGYIVLSDYERKNILDFFARDSDVIIKTCSKKSKRSKRVPRRIRKWYRKCRKQKRRNS